MDNPLFNFFSNSITYEKLDEGGHGSILEYENTYAIVFGKQSFLFISSYSEIPRSHFWKYHVFYLSLCALVIGAD
jgi:hypothetical protein